jgi:hypothetical protein
MPRQPRPNADGLLYHALNRDNNRGAVFASAADFATPREQAVGWQTWLEMEAQRRKAAPR